MASTNILHNILIWLTTSVIRSSSARLLKIIMDQGADGARDEDVMYSVHTDMNAGYTMDDSDDERCGAADSDDEDEEGAGGFGSSAMSEMMVAGATGSGGSGGGSGGGKGAFAGATASTSTATPISCK
jgi:hypothetical protein